LIYIFKGKTEKLHRAINNPKDKRIPDKYRPRHHLFAQDPLENPFPPDENNSEEGGAKNPFPKGS